MYVLWIVGCPIVLFHLAIVLFVLRLTDSDYPFGTLLSSNTSCSWPLCSLVLCAMFCRSLFVLLFFNLSWPLCSLVLCVCFVDVVCV